MMNGMCMRSQGRCQLQVRISPAFTIIAVCCHDRYAALQVTSYVDADGIAREDGSRAVNWEDAH